MPTGSSPPTGAPATWSPGHPAAARSGSSGHRVTGPVRAAGRVGHPSRRTPRTSGDRAVPGVAGGDRALLRRAAAGRALHGRGLSAVAALSGCAADCPGRRTRRAPPYPDGRSTDLDRSSAVQHQHQEASLDLATRPLAGSASGTSGSRASHGRPARTRPFGTQSRDHRRDRRSRVSPDVAYLEVGRQLAIFQCDPVAGSPVPIELTWNRYASRGTSPRHAGGHETRVADPGADAARPAERRGGGRRSAGPWSPRRRTGRSARGAARRARRSRR